MHKVNKKQIILILAAILISTVLFLNYWSALRPNGEYVFDKAVGPYPRRWGNFQRVGDKITNPHTTTIADNQDGDNDKLSKWMDGVLKLHKRFKSLTTNSCNNTCSFEDRVCKAKTLKHWEALISNDTLKAMPVYPTSNVDDYIFPWEKDYLSQPPLQDIKLLPDLRLSRIHFLPDGRTINFKKSIVCKKDDRLIFRVDLIDSYGNQRKLGGDDVRAWLTDKSRTSSATGTVRDMGNGTYLVTGTAVWTGTVNLNVAVVYPREYLRAALHHMKEGRHRFIYGLFVTKGASEVTICHPTPNIPGRPCVCNYTTFNRRPYYCGRPLNKRLTCKDWTYIRSAMAPLATYYTEAEAEMASKMSRSLRAATIKHDILITTLNNDSPKELQLCKDVAMNRSLTWTKPSPRGMWTKKGRKLRWDSFLCNQSQVMTSPKWIQNCLKSTTVWMIGDSNLQRLKLVLEKLENFTYTTPKRKGEYWTQERVLRNVEINSTIVFRGHEYPLFHSNTNGYMPILDQGGVEDFFRKIPSIGRTETETGTEIDNPNHIVVIHYNLHFSPSHLSAIFQRFVAIRDAVIALLARNPSVLVAIRGPHIATMEWQRNHIFGGDVQARFIVLLLQDVFKNLRDKIVFLDGMDTTTSLNNPYLHPPDIVPLSMLRELLSFKCH